MIDTEWEAFLQTQNAFQDARMLTSIGQPMTRIPNQPVIQETAKYSIKSDPLNILPEPSTELELQQNNELTEAPICNELHISTKTNVLYLNQSIDINHLFWLIPVIEYWKPNEGVIKKQMKIVSNTLEEFEALEKRLKSVSYYTEKITRQINNPTARKIKFKDERKITIGISKKDIMNCRGKEKNAFFNCFAIILRMKHGSVFKEVHVKVFNSGKLEIPGILEQNMLSIVQQMILRVLQPYIEKPLEFGDSKDNDIVLINSNFNCGFHIDLKKLNPIMKNKYKIETSYDSSHYPGIKCKFYFDNTGGLQIGEQSGRIKESDLGQTINQLDINQKYTKISFMIFRTGSGLILGNCTDEMIKYIFEFIKNILTEEYNEISMKNTPVVVKEKKVKTRKKNINVSSNYYMSLVNV
jgi:hypothetical protein